MDLLAESFQRDGFVKVESLLTRDEAIHFRQAALDAAGRLKAMAADNPIFAQYVNVWSQDAGMRELTLHPKIAQLAKRLAGADLRIWHDQILIKEPGSSKATEFHQDLPYWPHLGNQTPISCWIALGDVPVESGCMTFLPGQHHRSELSAQDLSRESSLFEMAPDLIYTSRVTLPLRAGDVTFHHGLCPHMATPNRSGDKRVAHVVIFMDSSTKFSGAGHVVTDPLEIKAGEPLNGSLFPLV